MSGNQGIEDAIPGDTEPTTIPSAPGVTEAWASRIVVRVFDAFDGAPETDKTQPRPPEHSKLLWQVAVGSAAHNAGYVRLRIMNCGALAR